MTIPHYPSSRKPAPRSVSSRSTFVENYLGETLALGAAIILAFGRAPAVFALSFAAALFGVVRYERGRARTFAEHDASAEALSNARSPRRYAMYAVAWGVLLVLVGVQSLMAEEPTPFGPGLIYGSVFVTNLLIYGYSVYRICQLRDDPRRAVSEAESIIALRELHPRSQTPARPKTPPTP